MNRHSSVAIGVMLILGWLGGPTRTVSAGQGQQSVPVASTGAAARAATTVPTLRGFSLTLVQGEIKAGQAAEGVPAAAAKALADLKDFLPYKSYSLLDTSWTAGTGLIKSRLRRPDGQSYDVEMTVNYPYYGTPNVAGIAVTGFHLREAGSGPISKQEAAEAAQKAALLRRELDAAVRNLAVKRQQLADGLVPESSVIQAERVADEWKTRVEAPKAQTTVDSIIDTSFRMDVGETVVVGTSRLQGDKALIVLVSAVAR